MHNIFKILITLFLITINIDNTSAQANTLIGKIEQFTQLLPLEKVYLHFDNTSYFRNEKIWFYATVIRADNSQQSNISGVLYVDLVAPGGYIIHSQKLKIVNGTADGCINLNTTTMTSGFYEVRAYTRYMLNWGEDAMFSRVFPVFEVPDKDGDYNTPRIETQQAPAVKRNITFYPEGGHLIEGLSNNVAFKLTDQNGLPLYANGTLECDGETICNVTTLHDGMGVFTITPQKGKNYTLQLKAKREDKEDTYKEKLPNAEIQGVTLSVTHNKQRVKAILQATQEAQHDSLTLLVTHNGKLQAHQTIKASSQPLIINMSADILHDGVNRLTVINSQGGILADRLLFAFPRDTTAQRITTQMTGLHPYGRTGLHLQTQPNTRISVSVRDAGSSAKGSGGDIRSWLLLTSDLKGYVSHPDYYLECDDATHHRATDLLMMVQGWKCYDLNQMMGKKQFVFKQPIETQLSIRGRLKSSYSDNIDKAYRTNGNKSINDVDMHFKLYNKAGESLSGDCKTDNEGFYTMMVPDCTGDWTMYIQTSKNETARKLLVGIDRNFAPEARKITRLEMLPENYYGITAGNSDEHDRLNEEEESTSKYKKGDITKKVHRLKEVVVKKHFWDSNIPWDNQKLARKSSSLYFNIDKVSDTYADRGEVSPYVLDWMEKNIEGISGGSYEELYDEPIDYDGNSNVKVVYDSDFGYKNMPTLWVVDNYLYKVTNTHGKSFELVENSHRSITSVPHQLEDVKAIYICEDDLVSKRFLLQHDLPECATVFIYTHHTAPYKVKGLRRTHFEGYATPQTFEHIDYAILPKENDHRRTLYWNPSVMTNEQGLAKISFYNNSSCKEVIISAEGLTANGIPLANK